MMTMTGVLVVVKDKQVIEVAGHIMGHTSKDTVDDSGANVMAVYLRLVPRSAYTGKYIRCRTFSGRIEVFPQCRLFIRTPYYTG